MKTVIWISGALLSLSFCGNPPKKMEKKEVTSMQGEWEVLFDGSSTDQWHIFNGEGISEDWHIEDGALVFRPIKGHPKQNLVTNKEYTTLNYH